MDEMFCFQCQQTAHNENATEKQAYAVKKRYRKSTGRAYRCTYRSCKSGGVRYTYGQHRPPCFERTFHDYHQCQLQYKTVNELTAEVEEEKRKYARARLTTMSFQDYGKQAMIFAR